MSYGIDAYVFLTRPSSVEVLEELRAEGHVRTVIRTVSGPHQEIVALEADSLELLPGTYARLGVDTERGDLVTVGLPVPTTSRSRRVNPKTYAAFVVAVVEYDLQQEWHETYAGSADTVAVSGIFGFGAATHLIEVTNNDLRELNSVLRHVLSHVAVTPIETYLSGSAMIQGAGPRP